MRKRLIQNGVQQVSEDEHSWLNLEAIAQVEITSEDQACPIEAALVPGGGCWRAAVAGEQTIRLLFDEALSIGRVRLIFQEDHLERTQEFVLRWSADRKTYHDIARQQYNFSLPDSSRELEDYVVDLHGVSALELCIVPDISKGEARASLAEWRIA
jgi:hypothetical protein